MNIKIKRINVLSAVALSALTLLGFQNVAVAQNRPKWRGVLATQAPSFNAFMRRNIGKTIDLSVTFADAKYAAKTNSAGEPHTSLGGDTGPMFQVGGNFYRVENGGNEHNWRTLMGYDKNRRQLAGTFTITNGVKSGEDSGFNYDLRWRPSFQRDVKVVVVSEKGRVLLRSSGITLRGGHIQVPVGAYKIMGFDVRRDIDKGQVSIGTPERYSATSPDLSTFDIVYNSLTYSKSGSETKLFTDFKPPFALLQNGEFFVAPSLVQRRFADKISTKWNANTRTLTLRRSAGFAGYLDNISEVA